MLGKRASQYRHHIGIIIDQPAGQGRPFSRNLNHIAMLGLLSHLPTTISQELMSGNKFVVYVTFRTLLHQKVRQGDQKAAAFFIVCARYVSALPDLCTLQPFDPAQRLKLKRICSSAATGRLACASLFHFEEKYEREQPSSHHIAWRTLAGPGDLRHSALALPSAGHARRIFCRIKEISAGRKADASTIPCPLVNGLPYGAAHRGWDQRRTRKRDTRHSTESVEPHRKRSGASLQNLSGAGNTAL